MPRSGSGVYSLPAVYLAVPGTTVRAVQHNEPLQDLAQAMTDSLPRNGSAPMVGNLNMNGRKIFGLAAATAAGDVPRFDQVPTLGAYLSSVSTLTFAADRISYATGPSTSALAVLTAFGRSLIDDVDATAARATLGLPLSTNADFTVDPASVTTRAAIKTFVDALQLTFRNANSLGWGAAIQDVTASRSAGTTYQNTSGRPMFWSIYGQGGSPRYMQTSVNGTTWMNSAGFGSNGEGQTSSVLVAPNLFYRAAPGLNIYGWWETL